jgi:hypothetical protein
MSSNEIDMTLPPAERLRQQILNGRGRFTVVAATTLVWVMDLLLQKRLASVGLRDGGIGEIPSALDAASTYVFLLTSAPLLYSILKPLPQWITRFAGVYVAFACFQVVANVLGMVTSAQLLAGNGLGSLWDIGAMYAMSVTVFMFVYVLMDLTTPGGAFVWPSRDGEPAPTPNLFDYLFISLNVNSTYGPTSEAVMSRPTKLIMAGQVLLAILMLTVLIARAAAAV